MGGLAGGGGSGRCFGTEKQEKGWGGPGQGAS